MTLLQNDFAKGIRKMPGPNGSEVVSVRLEYSLAAALALNDIMEIGDLPEDCVPVDAILDADDLDTNGVPTITLSLGVLNAAKTDIDVTASSGGAAWIAASNVAQVGGGLARPATVAITRVQPSSAKRPIGVKVQAGPATGAAAGKVGVTFLYRAAFLGQ